MRVMNLAFFEPFPHEDLQLFEVFSGKAVLTETFREQGLRANLVCS